MTDWNFALHKDLDESIRQYFMKGTDRGDGNLGLICITCNCLSYVYVSVNNF